MDISANDLRPLEWVQHDYGERTTTPLGVARITHFESFRDCPASTTIMVAWLPCGLGFQRRDSIADAKAYIWRTYQEAALKRIAEFFPPNQTNRAK